MHLKPIGRLHIFFSVTFHLPRDEETPAVRFDRDGCDVFRAYVSLGNVQANLNREDGGRAGKNMLADPLPNQGVEIESVKRPIELVAIAAPMNIVGAA